MAYVKHNFVANETIITAAALNDIDDGIADNEERIDDVEDTIESLESRIEDLEERLPTITQNSQTGVVTIGQGE